MEQEQNPDVTNTEASSSVPVLDLSAVAESVQSKIAALLAAESAQSTEASHSSVADASQPSTIADEQVPVVSQFQLSQNQNSTIDENETSPMDVTQCSAASPSTFVRPLVSDMEQQVQPTEVPSAAVVVISDFSDIAESVQSNIAALLAAESAQSTEASPSSVADASQPPTIADEQVPVVSQFQLSQHQNSTIDENETSPMDVTQCSAASPSTFVRPPASDMEQQKLQTETVCANMSNRTDPALLAKQDEHFLRVNGFHPIGILCERIDLVWQRDKKAVEREKLRRERERRAEAAEQRRKERRDGSEESREHRKERKKQKREERHRSPLDKVRSEAVAPQKRNFNRIVQCSYCELIVRHDRFGGRESAYCSAECISRRVDMVRKCVKESERILMIDLKGNIYNASVNPTIETLEAFLNQNPSYNPIIDDARLAAANQRVVDPDQQKKIDLMRMEVRKAIETGLQKRCKAANMCFSMKRYKELGHDIERALFAMHQEVNVKYRKWFKGFITVVNDEKNAYFKEVMRDKVSVKRLVTLGEEQMKAAVPVLAVLAAADSTSADGANALPTSSSASALHTRQSFDNKKLSSAIHAKSAVDEILGERQGDTTLLHTTHLFDANCQICKEEQAKKLAMRKRAEELESRLDERIKLKQQQQGMPYFPNLDPSVRTENWDPSIISALSGSSSVMPTSRHHRTAASDFDPPLSSAAGCDTTPLMDSATNAPVSNSGYEHDPLGLNNVQVGDPLIDDEQQQRHPETNIDEDEDVLRFDGGAFDDNDYGEEEGTTEFNADDNNNMGKENDASNASPVHSDVLQQPLARQEDFGTPPMSGFSNGGFDKAGDNASQHRGGGVSGHRRATGDATDRHFQRVVPRPPQTPPPQRMPSRPVSVGAAGNVLPRPSDAMSEVHDMPQQHLFNEPEQQQPLDPWKTESLLVWRGLFVCSKQGFFNCTCTAVSGGLAVFKASREMMTPSSENGSADGGGGRIHLIGLSDSRGVWEYVMQLRESWNKMVCLLVINRPEEEQDFLNYMDCFAFYNQGTQVGVLDFAGHPTIKDGYVFTLSPGEPLPSVLLPLDGVGLPEWTQHNGCIMLMIVRRMDHEDKQWKRQRMGMGVGDESWRRQQQQHPQMMPMDIPLTPIGRGGGGERMAHLLSDPSRRFRPDDIDFAANVEPTDALIVGPVGPRSFGRRQMQMFDPCGNTPHQRHHSAQSRPMVSPVMFSEISPIGPPSVSSRLQHRYHPQQRSSDPVIGGAGPSGFGGTTESLAPHFQAAHSPAALMQRFPPSAGSFNSPSISSEFSAVEQKRMDSPAAFHHHTPLPSVFLTASPSAERTPHNQQQQNQPEFGDDELPMANTVDEVIAAIQRIDNPKKVVFFVGQFARRHEGKLTPEELNRIQTAIREAAAGRRLQQSPQQQQLKQQQQQSPRLERPPSPAKENETVSIPQEKESSLPPSATTAAVASVDVVDENDGNTQRPYSPSEWESLEPEQMAAAPSTTSATTATELTTTTTTAMCTSTATITCLSLQQSSSAAAASPLPKTSSVMSLLPLPPLPQPPTASRGSADEPVPPPPPPEESAKTADIELPPPPPPAESAELINMQPPPPPRGNVVHMTPPPPPTESAEHINGFQPPPPPRENVGPVPPPPPPAENAESVSELPPPPPPPSLLPSLPLSLPPGANVTTFLHSPPPPPPPPPPPRPFHPPPLPPQGNRNFLRSPPCLLPPSPSGTVAFLHTPPPPPPHPRPAIPPLMMPITTATTPTPMRHFASPHPPSLYPLRVTSPAMFARSIGSPLPPRMTLPDSMMHFGPSHTSPLPPWMTPQDTMIHFGTPRPSPMPFRMAARQMFPSAAAPPQRMTSFLPTMASPPPVVCAPSSSAAAPPRLPQSQPMAATTDDGTTPQSSKATDCEKLREDGCNSAAAAVDDDLAWAQMEIPPEFGLPTKFFSNKELWEDNRVGCSSAGGRRGGGAGRKGGGR